MIDFLTGASGFLGKHLMRKIGKGALSVRHDDIHDTAFPDCDRFFFLSTYGNMIGQTDVDEILRGNIGHLGYVLASYIQDAKCNQFVYVSSSSVNLPVQTPYSHAKRAGEEMVLASCIPAVVVRPYSITGRGEQKSHLIPTLIRSCMEGEHVTLTPWPTHDFIDVDDVVNGLIAIADSKAKGVFEFGSGMATTNGEVLNMVEEICDRKANVTINETETRPYDATGWCCKDFEARHHGWAPKKSLAHSISEMVEAYKFTK